MLGRLYQVAIPTDVFDGAEMIRVMDVQKLIPSDAGFTDPKNPDNKEDLYIKCRYSIDNEYKGENFIPMDAFCDFIGADIIIEPEADKAAKMLLLGNKV